MGGNAPGRAHVARSRVDVAIDPSPGAYPPLLMATPLDSARYINLMSFKRDGAGVETPVWAAPLDGKLVVFTNRDSYKVKRIGRNPKVRVARCNARGKLLGPW